MGAESDSAIEEVAVMGCSMAARRPRGEMFGEPGDGPFGGGSGVASGVASGVVSGVVGGEALRGLAGAEMDVISGKRRVAGVESITGSRADDRGNDRGGGNLTGSSPSIGADPLGLNIRERRHVDEARADEAAWRGARSSEHEASVSSAPSVSAFNISVSAAPDRDHTWVSGRPGGGAEGGMQGGSCR